MRLSRAIVVAVLTRILPIIALFLADISHISLAEDMDTDAIYQRSCASLVDRQWTQHENHADYTGSKLLFVQRVGTATDNRGVVSRDYCAGVAFLRADQKYDLTVLRCLVWPDRPAEIERTEACVPPDFAQWEGIRSLAESKLPNMTANRWVLPYTAGMPPSLQHAREVDHENAVGRLQRAQTQQETDCVHRATAALHEATTNHAKEFVESGVDADTFLGRVYQSCMSANTRDLPSCNQVPLGPNGKPAVSCTIR